MKGAGVNMNGGDVQTITTKRLSYAVQMMIDRQQIACAVEPRVIIEPMMDSLVARLEAYLIGRDVHVQVIATEYVPLGPMDYVLAALPEWMRWRAPRTRTITTAVTHTHVCPHIATPSNRDHFDFLGYDECDIRPRDFRA